MKDKAVAVAVAAVVGRDMGVRMMERRDDQAMI